MYKFYQTKEKGKWIPVQFTPDTEAVVREQDAKRMTILAVSELVNEETTDKHNLSYKGPLYFDIDCKDLNQSISSTVALIQKLLKMGVPRSTIEVFASGSKGFHVLIDQQCFSSGRATKKLPLIYKEMAMTLHVPGMDFQVYSQGRGNCFRLVNVQRDDGRYRVQVTIEELLELDAEKYVELCSQPRFDIKFPEPEIVKVPELEVTFQTAKNQVNAKPKIIAAASDTELQSIAKEVPVCVQELASYRNIQSDKNFNQVAMQIAIYIARSGIDKDRADSLLSLMAENSHSTKYDSTQSRLEHLQGQLAYIQSSPNYKFGCNAMRDLLTQRPCEGCPIEKEGDGLADEALQAAISKRVDGYYVMGEKQDRKISTFTLEPVDVFMEVPQDGSTPRRTGTVVDVIKNESRIATVVMSENAWLSRSNFVRELEGLSNLMFLGSDADVQRIKLLTYEEGQDMGEIMQVYTCGIHIHYVGDKAIFTYVEPGLSINQMKVSGTHKLQGRIVAAPKFDSCEICPVGDEEADLAITNLLRMNAPTELAMIVGWFVACHLKMHLKVLYNQFPILNVWGNAGSGKSATTGLVSWLNGTDYMMEDTGINVSNITPYAAIEYCASTTTVPRIMEEYNQSKMTSKNYNTVGEMLKASWNSEAILRGSLASKSNAGRTGATTTEIPITGPLVAISEQGFQMPALLERSVQVMLSKNTRKGREEYWNRANSPEKRKKLRQIGKALMVSALTSTLQEVEEMMSYATEKIPSNIDDRPRYCLKVVLVGLMFLKKTCVEDLELTNCSKEIDLVINDFLDHAQAIGSKASDAVARTEVDAVIEQMALIAALSQGSDKGNNIFLKYGTHYMIKDDTLVIDTAICHAIYKKYCRNVDGEKAVINSARTFKDLLREEVYYEGETKISHFASGREVFELSISKMEDKGIDTSLFMTD